MSDWTAGRQIPPWAVGFITTATAKPPRYTASDTGCTLLLEQLGRLSLPLHSLGDGTISSAVADGPRDALSIETVQNVASVCITQAGPSLVCNAIVKHTQYNSPIARGLIAA